MATDENTNEHYKVVSSEYHKFWFYGKDTPYEKWQLEHVQAAFSGPDCSPLSKACRIADVGGGTGRFASLLRSRLGLEQPVMCVDLSQSMLDEAQALEGVNTLCLGAVEYARVAPREEFDRVLLKEIVHLVPVPDLNEMYKGLFDSLKTGGVCVTVTRPKREIQYPFSQQARAVWEANQVDAAILSDAIKAAGFEVETRAETFPVTMKQADWLSFVENRIWSTFAETNFSNAQLQDTITEIKQLFPADAGGNITFGEVMVFLRAIKR